MLFHGISGPNGIMGFYGLKNLYMDLLGLLEPGFQARGVDSEEFLDEIARRLAQRLA